MRLIIFTIMILGVALSSCKKTTPVDNTIYCWECYGGAGGYFDYGCMTKDSMSRVHFYNPDGTDNKNCRIKNPSPPSHGSVSFIYNTNINASLDSVNELKCTSSSLESYNIANHTTEFFFTFYNDDKNSNDVYVEFSVLDDSLNIGKLPIGRWLKYAQNSIPDSSGYDTRLCNFGFLAGPITGPPSTKYKDGYLNVLITRNSNNTVDGKFYFNQNYIDSPSIFVQNGVFNNIPLVKNP